MSIFSVSDSSGMASSGIPSRCSVNAERSLDSLQRSRIKANFHLNKESSFLYGERNIANHLPKMIFR